MFLNARWFVIRQQHLNHVYRIVRQYCLIKEQVFLIDSNIKCFGRFSTFLCFKRCLTVDEDICRRACCQASSPCAVVPSTRSDSSSDFRSWSPSAASSNTVVRVHLGLGIPSSRPCSLDFALPFDVQQWAKGGLYAKGACWMLPMLSWVVGSCKESFVTAVERHLWSWLIHYMYAASQNDATGGLNHWFDYPTLLLPYLHLCQQHFNLNIFTPSPEQRTSDTTANTHLCIPETYTCLHFTTSTLRSSTRGYKPRPLYNTGIFVFIH